MSETCGIKTLLWGQALERKWKTQVTSGAAKDSSLTQVTELRSFEDHNRRKMTTLDVVLVNSKHFLLLWAHLLFLDFLCFTLAHTLFIYHKLNMEGETLMLKWVWELQRNILIH